MLYVKISDSVRLRHIAILSGAGGARPQPSLYPLERGDVQAYNIAAGQSTFQRNDLFLGNIPRCVLVGLVTNAAYAGINNQNPFNFQLKGLKSLKLLVKGEENPAAGIELDQNGQVNGYNSLMFDRLQAVVNSFRANNRNLSTGSLDNPARPGAAPADSVAKPRWTCSVGGLGDSKKTRRHPRGCHCSHHVVRRTAVQDPLQHHRGRTQSVRKDHLRPPLAPTLSPCC